MEQGDKLLAQEEKDAVGEEDDARRLWTPGQVGRGGQRLMSTGRGGGAAVFPPGITQGQAAKVIISGGKQGEDRKSTRSELQSPG